jgi:hypothetical protein
MKWFNFQDIWKLYSANKIGNVNNIIEYEPKPEEEVIEHTKQKKENSIENTRNRKKKYIILAKNALTQNIYE